MFDSKIPVSSFIIIASLAAELDEVMLVAKEISLAAANAKAIAFRAGEKTKGFQPITDFINDLAKDTITLVDKINRYAFDMYLIAIDEYRSLNALNALRTAQTQSEHACFIQSLSQAIVTIDQRHDVEHKALVQHVYALLSQLDEIMNYARAASVIASNSRIESSQAGDYAESLQAVAESVEYAAKVIHEKAVTCKKKLQTLDIN